MVLCILAFAPRVPNAAHHSIVQRQLTLTLPLPTRCLPKQPFQVCSAIIEWASASSSLSMLSLSKEQQRLKANAPRLTTHCRFLNNGRKSKAIVELKSQFRLNVP
jgi:hypothetical protein